MDKVKIQEIAEEAGLSNGELIEKAKELGFNVKAANSAISVDDAGILVDYAISGTLPKGFKKPSDKPKLKVVKKKPEDEMPKTAVEAPVEEEVAPEAEAVEVLPEKTEVSEVSVEETAAEETPVEETPAEKTVESEPEVLELDLGGSVDVRHDDRNVDVVCTDLGGRATAAVVIAPCICSKRA